MCVCPSLLLPKPAMCKSVGSSVWRQWGLLNWTLYGEGGDQAPHTVPGERAYFRSFWPRAVPFAQLL